MSSVDGRDSENDGNYELTQVEQTNGKRSDEIVVQNSKDWSTGLFACPFNTCVTLDEWFCCPCVSCRFAVLVGENCFCPCRARTKLRQKFGIRSLASSNKNVQGSELEDVCLLAWCGPCTFNQMLREIETLYEARKPKDATTALTNGDHNGNAVTKQPEKNTEEDLNGEDNKTYEADSEENKETF